MRRTPSALAASAAALTLGLGLHGAAASAKTIAMTAVGAPPPIVTPVKVTKDYIIPEINRRLAASHRNFTIHWTEAWSQSLAKFNEVLETVQSGIAQFGVQLVNFEESKLPLEQYGSVVPFSTRNKLVAVAIDRKLRKEIPEMNKMWHRYDQIHLASAAGEPDDLFTNFPVHTLADLNGRKIGASGAEGQFLRGTGAVAVNSSMADSYTDIKNGVYDGYVIAIVLALPYRTYEVAKYRTKVGFAVGIIPELSINTSAWKKLPGFAQKIFREVTAKYGEECAKVDDQRIAKFTRIMKKSGVKFSDLPAAEKKKWAMDLPNIAEGWARRLDKEGLPGTKELHAYMDQLRARHIQTYRQWDREAAGNAHS